MADREEMSTSFGAAAGAYEAGRPDYPRAAVEWMLQPVVTGGARARWPTWERARASSHA